MTQHKDTTLDEPDELDRIINKIWDGYNETKASQAKQALLQWRDKAVVEAVYGFHEYIMGKNIIQKETDQAFNYARLHNAIDDYIAGRNVKRVAEKYIKDSTGQRYELVEFFDHDKQERLLALKETPNED